MRPMNNERGLNCVPFYFAFTCHTRGFANRLKVVWPVFRHVKAAFIRTSSQSFLSSFLLHLRKLSQISVNATRFVFERNLNDGICVVDFFLTSICFQDGAAKMVRAANRTRTLVARDFLFAVEVRFKWLAAIVSLWAAFPMYGQY